MKKLYPLIVLVSVVILNTIRFPSLILEGEPYAETGKLYFHLAHHYGFLDNLLYAVGYKYPSYYPLLGRVIAFSTAKLPYNLGITYFPQIVNGFALLFIAIFASLFFSSILKKKFSINAISALLFSIVITLHADIGLFFLFNLGYFSVFLGTYFLLVNPEEFSNFKFGILSLLGFLILMSKPFFVAFLPFYFFLFVFSIYKKRTKASLFYLSLLITLCILFYNLSVASSVTAKTGIVKLPLAVLIERVMYFTYYSLGYSIFGFFGFTNNLYATVVSGVSWALLFTFIFILLKRKSYESILYSLFLLLIAGICSTLTVMAFKHSIPIYWGTSYLFPDHSHFLFTILLSTTSFFILFSSVFKSYKWQLGFVTLLAISSGCFGYFKSASDPYLAGARARSNWKNYSPIIISSMKNDSYCVPSNPNPWIVNRNCIWLTSEVHIGNKEFTKIVSNESEGLFVNGVEIVFKDERVKKGLQLVLVDKNQNILETFTPIWEKGRPFSFYKVERELKADLFLSFKNRSGKLKNVTPGSVRVFGCPLSNRKCYELLSVNYFNV